jgi:hypothetical protein
LTAVNDTMSDGVKVIGSPQHRIRPGKQVGQNSLASPGMFPQLELLADFRTPRTSENQLRRLYRPVNSALGQQHFGVRLKEAELKAAGSGIANEDFHFAHFWDAVMQELVSDQLCPLAMKK